MIEINNLSKQFITPKQTVAALKDVSLSVPAGSIFGVVGPSGAGKSTLIRCVNLLEKPDSGSIRVNGQEITRLPTAGLRKARQHMGMIFQHFNLLSTRTVAQNIAFPLEVTGHPPARCELRVRELLQLVGLQDKADAYPAQLSGGQKQRVGIARALASQPEVLLSDEATSALDPQNTRAILDLLGDLNRRLGLTILLITHEMEVIRQICDRAAVIDRGEIVEQGTMDELVTLPGSRLSQTLLPAFQVQRINPLATSVTITFHGLIADRPILNDLIRKYDVHINIIAGNLQKIGHSRIGKMQVEIDGAQTSQALHYLQQLGLGLEYN